VAQIGAFDVAVVGGGIMGCQTALDLACGGMRTVLLERRGLCMEASGVNAGTLAHRMCPIAMQAYYSRAIELWKTLADRLGADVGFRERGGLTIAFTAAETERLTSIYEARKATGVEIELIDGKRARELEPNLSERVACACYFPRDGFADSNRTGYAFHKALTASGATVRTGTNIDTIEPDSGGFAIRAAEEIIHARRVVICAGAWVRKLVALFGLEFTQSISIRVNMMSVTERMPRLFHAVVTHANGGLTLKQPDNGTVLIGGGWQGVGTPETGGVEIIRANLATNLRLTHSAFPGIAKARLVRTWLGIESRMADEEPIAGALPGVDGVFVLGTFNSGWTGGPYIGGLMASLVLGREPERPLFDPARVMRRKSNWAGVYRDRD
jgi:sarcosine oxidase, subunit beta